MPKLFTTTNLVTAIGSAALTIAASQDPEIWSHPPKLAAYALGYVCVFLAKGV